MIAFNRSLTLFGAAAGRPIIFKNLYASMRLEPIATQFPGAIFIHVIRDLRDNAHSILKGRMDTFGTYEHWWSLPPQCVETLLDLPAERQVVEQILSINDQIKQDALNLGFDSRVLQVHYEDVCDDPAGFISQIEAFAIKNGIKLSRSNETPKRFSISRKTEIPDELNEALQLAVNEKINK
jgi:hypothetical protein